MRHLLNGRFAEGSATSRQLVASRAAIALTVTLLAALAGAPSVALAGSLLSGYGGPGEGSQAILGSAVLNAPSGGSGSGTSGGGGAATSGGGGSVTSSGGGSANAASRSLTSPPSANHERAASSESSVSAGRARPTTGQPAPASGAGHGAATARATSRGTVSAVPASDRSAVGSQALGLTLADLLYALLALAALAAVWALTAGLERARANATISGAKGTAPGIRSKP
jgi:hypothetical protein